MTGKCPVRGLELGDFEKVASYAAGVLKNATAAKLPYDQEFMKRSMTLLYNAVLKRTNGNKVSAANFAAAFPMALKVMLEYKNKEGQKPYFKHALETMFDFQKLNEDVGLLDQVEAADRIQWVNDYLGFTEDLSLDYNDAVDTANRIQEQRLKEEAAAKNTVAPPSSSGMVVDEITIKKGEKEAVFIATPDTSLRTTGLENIIGTDIPDTSDPVKVFSYKVMRNVLEDIINLDENDSRKMRYPAASDGVYIKFISREKVNQDGLDPFMMKGSEDSPYYVTLVNKNGDYLNFNKDTGENVMLRQDGNPVVYPVPQIALDSKTKMYYYPKNTSMYDRSVQSYMRHNNISDVKLANQEVQKQMAVSYAIRQKLVENPMSDDVIGFVNGGSPGFILYDENIRNTIKDIDFPNGKTIRVDTLNELGKGKGVAYLYVPELNNHPIMIERADLSDDIIDKIALLLTEPDIINVDTDAPMSIKLRKEIIHSFLNDNLYKSNLIDLMPTLDPKQMLRLRSASYSLETPAQREAARREIRDIFKSQHSITIKGKEKKVYTAKLNILQSLFDSGIDVANIRMGSDGKYYYEEQRMEYVPFLEEQGIYVKYRKNEQNRLVKLNPYMTFGFDQQLYNQLDVPIATTQTAIENLEKVFVLKEQYKGKFIYSTPGTGKTTIVGMSDDLVDADDIILEYLKGQPGTTIFGDTYAEATNSTVGLYMTSLYEQNPVAADEIYEKVLQDVRNIIKTGKTVLTGSHRLIPDADIVMIDQDSSKLAEQLARKSSPKHANILNNSVIRITASEMRAMEETPNKVMILEKQLWDVSTDPVLFDKKEVPVSAVENVQYEGKTEFNKLPAKSSVKNMIYAGIGSRETPKEILDLMTKAAEYLESKGYTLRSGGAAGADKAFELGVESKKEIFPGNVEAGKREHAIAKEIHPAWDKMMESARAKAKSKGNDPEKSASYVANLMARNTNQIFGSNLDSPVDFVLFYAQEVPGSIRPKGGTGQAVEMARLKGIPTINMADPDWREQLKDVLEGKSLAFKLRKMPAGFEPVSPDYGVYKSDKNLSKEQTDKFVGLVRPQAESQIFKENVGKNANMMWHYGLRWGRLQGNPKMGIPPMFDPIKNTPFDKGVFYGYDRKDQMGRPLPSLDVLKPIMDEITARTGIDMSNYDSVIANLYLEGEYIYPHRDTTEDVSAEKYPVVVYTLGNDAALGIWDNNKGNITFANTYDSRYAPDNLKNLAPTNEVLTKNGTIYTFGLEGKGRFNLVHTTPDVTKKPVAYPPIKLPDGTTVTNYTITLTFRRAQATTIESPTSYAGPETKVETAPKKVVTKKSITRDDLIKTDRVIFQDDVDAYNAYVTKYGKQPIEWFTHNTVFKEFYSAELGKRQRIPDSSIWNLDSNGYYDLIDKETGEIYIENVDMRSGYSYKDKNAPEQPEPEVVIDTKKEAKQGFKRWPLRFNMGYKRVAEWDLDNGRWQFVNKQGKLIPFGKLNDRLAKELAQKEGIVHFWYNNLSDEKRNEVDNFIDDYFRYAVGSSTEIKTDQEIDEMLYESDIRYRLMSDLTGKKFRDDEGFLKNLHKDTRKSAWATKGGWFGGTRVYGKGKPLTSFDIQNITSIDFYTNETFNGYDAIDAYKLAIEIVNDYPNNITRADLKDYRNKVNPTFNQEQLLKEFIDKYGLDLMEASIRIPTSPIYDRKAKMSKKKPSDNLGRGPADNTDLPFKNLFQKETEIKATEEQIKEAEEFYKTTPLAKYLPFQIIQNAMNLPQDKVAAWTKGGIILTKRADMTDYYHEAFEGFVRTFMTQPQLTELIRQSRNLPGSFVDYNGIKVSFASASSDQLLEFLAEGFRNYMLSPDTYEFNTKEEKSIFEWLKNILRILFDGATLDSLNGDPIEASAYVKNLYQKLRVGDLTGYSFQGITDKKDRITTGMLAYAPMATKDQLTFSESAVVVSTIDALLSEYGDMFPLVNSGEITEAERDQYVSAMDKTYMGRNDLLTESDKAVKEKVTRLLNQRMEKDGGFSIQLVKNKQRRSDMYSYVYKRLLNKLALIKSDPGMKIPGLELKYKNKADLLEWVISNYGDPSFEESNVQTDQFGNLKGVIGYHLMNSEVIETSDKEDIIANYDLNEDEIYELAANDSGRDIFGDGGNRVSIYDRADSDLIHVLKSLYQPNTTGDAVELNDLFTPKLISFDRVWNNLVRLLEGTRDREDMWRLLQEESVNFPAYKQLLAKLGSPQINPNGNFSIASFTLWNKILNVFSNTHLPLIQTTLKETTVDENGNELKRKKYVVTVGTASAVYRRVGDLWERGFQDFDPSFSNRLYVKRDPETGKNFLNIDKLLKEGKPKTADQLITFLNRMGIDLENSPSTRSMIAKNKDLFRSIIGFWDKLDSINEYNSDPDNKGKIVINGVTDLVNRESGTAIRSLQTSYNKIQQLQARYSDYHSNFMVTNAEHNAQFEHSLNSTFTTMLNVLADTKKYPKYQDVIALPQMRHLDVNNTPFARESTLLNSLFILDVPTHHENYGKRRVRTSTGEPIKIEMHLLSGITLLSDDEFVKGVGNANADVQSKLLGELHNFARLQTLENVRHSDKTTSHSFGVDYILANGAQTPYYVPVDDFSQDKNRGFRKAAKLMSKHLSAELERINQFRGYTKAQKAQMFYDFDYIKRGQSFVIFEDMPDELEEKLLNLPKDKKLTELMENDPALSAEVLRYLTDYLKIQSKKISDRIAQSEFIDKNMMDELGVDRQALIDAFVSNSIVHNLESLSFIYGDPAMYRIEKEEFHKRNSGVGGTGTIMATDRAARAFVNSNQFNKDGYAKSVLGNSHSSRQYDGSIDTAVFEDPVVRSAYFDSIVDAKKADMIAAKPGITEEEINEKLFGSKTKDGVKTVGNADNILGGEMKPYAEMKVADAQGYITFDGYRMLRALGGRWTPTQETYYQKIIAGEQLNVSTEKLLEIFPPEKYQYWGQIYNKNWAGKNMMPLTAMHKFAVMPLIPTVIGNNRTLSNLHDKMMREGVTYATFGSGSKIASISRYNSKTDGNLMDKVFNTENGKVVDFTIHEQMSNKAPQFTLVKNTIFVDYLKNQVEIEAQFKNNISFSTQLRKIIEDGLMENGVPIDFMRGYDENTRVQKWSDIKDESQREQTSPFYKRVRDYERNLDELTEIRKNELIEEMGITFDNNGNITSGIENFINFVKRELNRREIGNHVINMLGVNERGEIKIPLDLSLQADEIERMLNNIITKRIVKLKIKGEGFIQVSNALFEDRSFAFGDNGRDFRKPTDEDLRKYGTIDLPYYMRVSEDGKTVVKLAKAKIAMHGNFKYLFNLKDLDGNKIGVWETVNKDGEEIKQLNMAESLRRLNNLLKNEAWLNKDDHRKMVTISGPRIPVQGLNSAEAFEVYEFLPEEAGPIIITPAEIVAKSGSDFDKDTLFLMTPHIYMVNGKVKLHNRNLKGRLTKKQIGERLMELEGERSVTYRKYQDMENRAIRMGVLKITDEEKAALDRLNREYSAQSRDINQRIVGLESLFLEVNKGNIRGIEAVRISDNLYNAYVENDILRRNYEDSKTLIYSRKNEAVEKFYKKKNADLKKINDEIESLTDQKMALSSGAVENEIIGDYVGMITLPENYSTLTRPNDVDIVKPLADQLAKIIKKYKSTEYLFSKKKANSGRIAGTRIIEMEYNLSKHEENNVGKQVLGIGAVDNTYNILYNRVGMYVKHYNSPYTDQELERLIEKNLKGEPLTYKEKRAVENRWVQNILMPHNTLNKNGYEVISLSHTYDKEGKNRIGDVISQLINGWVDVAKDAWVFNLQGNKEIAPALLFLIQTGVPFRQAVYFVSQPLVMEYIKQQRAIKSAFGEAIESVTTPDQANMFRNQARANILNRNGFRESIKALGDNSGYDFTTNVRYLKGPLYKFANSFLSKSKINDFDINTLGDNLEKDLTGVDDFQRAAFLHFLQIEDMAKASTEFKMATNVDTTKTATVFSAIDRLIKIEKLKSNNVLPGEEMLDKLKKGSPISSFFTQDFQLNIAEKMFPVRDSKSVIEFIKAKNNMVSDDVEETFGENNNEEFWNSFRNNMMSFIFQNALYDFDPDKMTSYKGMNVDKSFDVQKVPSLLQRVVVSKDKATGKDVLYIDVKGIEQDFDTGRYSTSYTGKYPLKPTLDKNVIPYAKLDPNTFNVLNIGGNDLDDVVEDDQERRPVVEKKETYDEVSFRENASRKNQYVKFVIEREILRSQISLSDAKLQFDYQRIINNYDLVSRNLPRETREVMAYEMFLRDRALDNIHNPFKMFIQNGVTMAETFNKIKVQYKDELSKYPVIDALMTDSGTLSQRNKTGGIKNIRLRNPKPDKMQINIYHENLKELADKGVMKVENKEVNDFISDFFDRMTIYGYIQSGLNQSGRFNLNKILPQERFIDFMTSKVKPYMEYLNQDTEDLSFYELYYNKFTKTESIVNKRYGGTARYKAYYEPFNLEYLRNLDRRQKGKKLKKLKPLIPGRFLSQFRFYGDVFGMAYFKPEIYFEDDRKISHMNDIKTYYSSQLDALQTYKGKKTIFVHNALSERGDNIFNLAMPFYRDPNLPTDITMEAITQSNKYGLTTVLNKGINVREIKDDLDENKMPIVNQEMKRHIDGAIKDMMDILATGQAMFVFNDKGYGVHFAKSAPKTYQYLSEQLGKLGYANPLSKVMPEAIMNMEDYYQSPMTYEEAAEIYRKCLM